MDRREKSREKWEQEFRDDQYNILPADGSRVGHIMAKRSSTPAPIPDLAHLIQALLAGALVISASAILLSSAPHKVWLGLAVLITGFYFGYKAFLPKNKR
jgi:hypothetical protein